MVSITAGCGLLAAAAAPVAATAAQPVGRAIAVGGDLQPRNCSPTAGDAIPAHPKETETIRCAGWVWQIANGNSNYGYALIRYAVTPTVYHKLLTDHSACFFPGPCYFPTAYISLTRPEAVVTLSGWGKFDMSWTSNKWLITRVPTVASSTGCGPT